MSETQNSYGLSPFGEERKSTRAIKMSDMEFVHSLKEFIEAEKKYLQCPEEGADERRYIIYRSAFNKVIGRATAYKKLLMAIKSEYDSSIRELERREDEVRAPAETLMLLKQSLMTCQKRANQLRDRISFFQTQTERLQEEIQSMESSKEQSTWMAGLTVAESEDLQALDRHLKDLETQKAALLDTKTQCVPQEVRTRLDAELQTTEHHRDRLSSENKQLKLLNRRLRRALERLKDRRQLHLEDIMRLTSSDDEEDEDEDDEEDEDDGACGVAPSRTESKLRRDYLDRFVQLFDSARYEDAALHAARSPRGILRNLDTMEMFTGVDGPPGSAPPPHLFFWALLVTMAAGDELSAPLSLQGVRCSLEHGNTQLVVHAVTQNKLTLSEELGDVLTEHAQKNPDVADVCLPLATSVYEACGTDKKAALCMCRSGLIHSAAELMWHSATPDDCMWVLCRSPSLSLLQLLTAAPQGRAAIWPVGGACTALLANPQHQQLVLQLLDGFISQGREVLKNMILEDAGSSVDVWNDVASFCSKLKREDLSQVVRSILLDQSGTAVRSPDLQGARLMEHVFM